MAWDGMGYGWDGMLVIGVGPESTLLAEDERVIHGNLGQRMNEAWFRKAVKDWDPGPRPSQRLRCVLKTMRGLLQSVGSHAAGAGADAAAANNLPWLLSGHACSLSHREMGLITDAVKEGCCALAC